MEWRGHMVAVKLCEEMSDCFLKQLHHFTCPPGRCEGSYFPIPIPALGVHSLDSGHPCGFDLCPFMAQEVEYLFMSLLVLLASHWSIFFVAVTMSIHVLMALSFYFELFELQARIRGPVGLVPDQTTAGKQVSQ